MFAYIITGESGEYDSWTKWNVEVFLDEKACDEYLKKLKKFLIDNNIPNVRDYDARKPSCRFIDSTLDKNWTSYGVEYKVEKMKVMGCEDNE